MSPLTRSQTTSRHFAGLGIRRKTVVVCVAALLSRSAWAHDRVEYNRDILPILVDKCFQCHGPDSASRKAGLRLDLRDAATKGEALVPGKPEESELVKRVFSKGRKIMPPAKTKKALTPAQKELLRRWVAAGASYQPHWSYIVPGQAGLPAVKSKAWPRNAIDYFVLTKLEANGLEPAAPADRRTLARRASLDLTGLPPAPAAVAAFVNDPSPDAYEGYVDRLLHSPHWGEHRGRYWLDAARYADTHGLHFDNYREMWPYRDWVINAFNRNLSFDQFTVEQLAGDLLPEATLEQQIASGFNRCNITTNEGGTIPEENLALYAKDRVETTSTVWLGLTANCASCHEHKYDPIPLKEFYQLAAFFRNTTQGAMDGNIADTPPVVVVPNLRESPRWQQLLHEAADLRGRLALASRAKDTATGKQLADQLTRVQREQRDIRSRSSVSLVMQERADTTPTARVLFRGQYDQPRDLVKPGVFSSLHPFPKDAPPNRLGLARWLVSPQNPLTARVIVNRFWQEVFGNGLVRTAGDLGISGEPPSHPELLDWLAVEFRTSGWDVKRFFKLLVTSATYRQACTITKEKLAKDPNNLLLSRGARFRMDAEMVRDYALAASGLLVQKIGGPSVKPYQPEGVWEAVGMIGSNTRDYRRDSGEKLYRRSLYTFWKRGAPPASMDIFNAPSREFCVVRRERTDTPLQALVTLNDPQFIEAARYIAQLALNRGREAKDVGQAKAVQDRFDLMGQRLLARPFRPEEIAVLQESLNDLLAYYRSHPDDAAKLLSVGESRPDPSLDRASLAAWTMLANQLMNLDETLNK